jgi:hypothetical protein
MISGIIRYGGNVAHLREKLHAYRFLYVNQKGRGRLEDLREGIKIRKYILKKQNIRV